MEVRNHKLARADGTAIRYLESPNQSTGISPIYLIIHYTAGLTMDGAVSWFRNKDANASAHLVIGRDGDIVQMVGFNRRAWHAGISRWGELEGMNRYALGIELVNAGRLRKRSSGDWVSWSNQVVPEDEVTVARHKHEEQASGWHEYTEAQIEAVIAAAHALHAAYGFADILGHEDVSPGRKSDPGPLFPMGSFKSRVMGRR